MQPKTPANLKTSLLLFGWLVFFCMDSHAQALESADIFNNILNDYRSAALGWTSAISDAASWLFWLLATISMVWTFGMMALRKADIGEFFAEFIRFTIFTGFFWWLLTNGPNFANSIYESLRQIGANASGQSGNGNLNPSLIADVGFFILNRVLELSTPWGVGDYIVTSSLAIAILITLTLISVNLLLLLVSAWILAYGGIFFLGFGGSRWTSDMAINYYKTVLGIAAELFTMVLIIGTGQSFINSYQLRFHQSATIHVFELAIILVASIILLTLINKVPRFISGIITGAGLSNINNFWSGSVIGATGMTAAAVTTTGAVMAAGAASISGDAHAIMTTFSAARENVSSNPDPTSVFASSGVERSQKNVDSGTSTPLSKVASTRK